MNNVPLHHMKGEGKQGSTERGEGLENIERTYPLRND